MPKFYNFHVLDVSGVLFTHETEATRTRGYQVVIP